MRRTLLLCVLVSLPPAVWPAAVRAATSPDCSAYIGAFAKDLETNTTVVDDLSRPYDPSPDHVVQSASRYNRDAGYSKLCPTSKKAYAEALLTTWRAWLEHATTHDDPASTVELAAQQLRKCAAVYSGTGEGTTCATWEDQVAKWQNDWALP